MTFPPNSHRSQPSLHSPPTFRCTLSAPMLDCAHFTTGRPLLYVCTRAQELVHVPAECCDAWLPTVSSRLSLLLLLCVALPAVKQSRPPENMPLTLQELDAATSKWRHMGRTAAPPYDVTADTP